MAHELIVGYGLDKKMEVIVSGMKNSILKLSRTLADSHAALSILPHLKLSRATLPPRSAPGDQLHSR
jgi:hypothetical protein